MADTADILKKLTKDYGSKVATLGDVDYEDTPRLPTGIFPFDLASGGGFPMGRVSIIYGPESCVAHDTFLQYCVVTDGKRQNHKGGTIENLYHRFHGLHREGRGNYQRACSLSARFTLPCMNDEGRVFHNDVVNVLKTGLKDCFDLVTSSGKKITATGDHKFFVGDTYLPLSMLHVGGKVFIHDNTHHSGRVAPRRQYKTMTVKHYHSGVAPAIVIEPSSGKKYLYYQVRVHRLVVEAVLNGLEFHDYVARLNSGDISGLEFLPSNMHIHHIDEDISNNAIENLALVSASSHGLQHSLERHNNLRFVVTEDTIVSITPCGQKETYDVVMEAPFNNYIANGLVVHNSNKTNICLLAIAEGQKLYPNKKAVFVDAEGAYDPKWSKGLGVDVANLIVVHPEYAEQAVDMLEAFLYATDVFAVVLDSIAALTTQNEVESGAEKMIVGGASLLIGKLFKKTAISFNRMRNQGMMPPAFISINQIRFKIGVMFGCFDYKSAVCLADGTTMKIGQIVNSQLPVEVLSMSSSGELVPRVVTGWHKNGEGSGWLKIVVAGGNSGSRMLRVTENHMVFTPSGEVPAGSLKVGDHVLTAGMQFYSSEQHEVILGSILGDGSLRIRKGGNRGCLRVGHGPKQKEYNEYKATLFGRTVGRGVTSNEFSTLSSLEFREYMEISKSKGLLHVPQKFVDRLTLRSLAIWYMDDGTYSGSHDQWGWGKPSISTKTLDADSLGRIAVKLVALGAGAASIKVGRGLTWGGRNAWRFMTAIAPFIPPCMQYKIKAGLRFGSSLPVATIDPIQRVYSEPVVSISPLGGVREKYDITVEGEHNYLVNGVVVHNSPETMPGGNAPKFSSSFTVRVYGKNVVDKTINAVMPAFKETSMIIQKWKMPILATHAEFKMLMLNHAGARPGTVLDWNTISTYLKELEYLGKAEKGGWLMMGETFKTLEECKAHLYSDPKLLMEVKETIIKEMVDRGGVAPGGNEPEGSEVSV